MSYAPFPLVWGFFGSGGGGGGGPSFGVIQTDFGTYPTASGSSDVLTLISADNTRYFFTGTALTDTITLTVNGLIPPGGNYGQILAKSSGTNFDVEWRDGVQVTSVYNNSGSTITKGSIVYINGASGNLPTIALSQANTEATSTKTYGFVVADISNMSSGSVVASGQIRDLDTFGVTEGVTLWLSPSTAGAYTTTKPTAPNHAVVVGVCTRAHPSQGTIEVKIQNGYELEELHNVSISSVSDKQYLSYESATSLWKNVSPSNLSEATSSVLTISGGTGAVHGSGTTIQVKQSSSSQSGYLSSTDWSTFNGKANLTSTTPSSVSSTNSVGTASDAAKADHTHAGVASIAKTGSTALTGAVTLTAGSNVTLTQSGNDITIASTGGGGGGGSGTVTDVSVVSANGLAGSVANSTTTPAITLSTTVTGVLKGNGTAISAATAGTDYQAPITGGATSITTSDLTASRTLVSDASGKVAASSVTSTTLGYLDATSSVQTQLNAKEPTLTKGNLTEATSSVLTITGGTGSVIGSGTSIQVNQATTSVSGYLSSTDWTTFNNKPTALSQLTDVSMPSSPTSNLYVLMWDNTALKWASRVTGLTASSVSTTNTIGSSQNVARADHIHRGVAAVNKTGSTALYGTVTFSQGTNIAITQSGNDLSFAASGANLTEATSSVLTITGGTGAVLGAGTTVQVKQSTTTTDGYLSSTDWNTFNGKPSITSTTPSSVASTNAVGTTTTAARADHTHAGVASVAKSGSTALTGAVTLSAGSNVTLTQSGNDISIASAALNWFLFSWEQRPGAGSSYQIVIPTTLTITSASTKYAKCTTAATGSSAVFTIYKNGVSAGTITFSTAATSGTFSITSDISLAAGDLLKITAPTTQNADLAEVAISLPWQ